MKEAGNLSKEALGHFSSINKLLSNKENLKTNPIEKAKTSFTTPLKSDTANFSDFHSKENSFNTRKKNADQSIQKITPQEKDNSKSTNKKSRDETKPTQSPLNNKSGFSKKDLMQESRDLVRRAMKEHTMQRDGKSASSTPIKRSSEIISEQGLRNSQSLIIIYIVMIYYYDILLYIKFE